MDELNYKNKTYKAPASWKECTPDQLEKLIGFCRLQKKDISDPIYELAVQLLFSITKKQWAQFLISPKEWQMLKDKVQWLFTPPDERPFLSFWHDGLNYILPEENFADTTALELAVAFIAWTDFTDKEEPDLTAIDRLIAVQCRPERVDLDTFIKSEEWNGDNREPFNESRMIARSKSLASMTPAKKSILLTYFETQAKIFLEQYESLFGGDGAPRYGDGRGWIMLLKNIAKDGHFGTFDQVGKQYAHLVYAALLDDNITAEETRLNEQRNG